MTCQMCTEAPTLAIVVLGRQDPLGLYCSNVCLMKDVKENWQAP